MSSDQDSFTLLIREVREGNQQAAKELISRFDSSVIRAVRRRLNRRLRNRFDSMDFTQDVWKSFFANLSVIHDFEHPAQLIAFLTRISTNKVIDECRRSLILQKNNVNRETSISEPEMLDGALVQQQRPSPSEVAIASEQRERLFHDQSPEYREIIELRLQGLTHGEIAEKLQVSRRTIIRFFQRLAERLHD